jgi:hypothetical protein
MGCLELSAAGSTNCFSYWESPGITIEDGKLYRVDWLVKSSVTDPDDAVQFRLRVTQPNAWQGWERVVSSYNSQGPSSTTPKWYSVYITLQATTGIDDSITLAFDIMSFDDTADTVSWLNLDEVMVQEVNM